MSLSIHPPRRSALGVAWAEDFSRGRVGVSKQGLIVEAAPNVVNFQGEFAVFPGNTAAWIGYNRLITTGATGITVGAWWRDITDTGASQALVSQAEVNINNQEFALIIDPNASNIVWNVRISGTTRQSTPAWNTWTGTHLLVATWETGDNLRVFVDGVQVGASGATYAGTIDDQGRPLIVGRMASTNYPLQGGVAGPFGELRRWSAAEIEAFYNRSLFH